MRFRAWCEEHDVGLDVLRDWETEELCDLTWNRVLAERRSPDGDVLPYVLPGVFQLKDDHFLCPTFVANDKDQYACHTKWTFTPLNEETE